MRPVRPPVAVLVVLAHFAQLVAVERVAEQRVHVKQVGLTLLGHPVEVPDQRFGRNVFGSVERADVHA